METPFSIPSSNANFKDILKNWVKDLAKFRIIPNQVYRTKILWKAYQYLVIFSYVWLREHGNLPAELGDRVGPAGQ